MGLRDMFNRNQTGLKIQDIEELLTKRRGRDGNVILRIHNEEFHLVPGVDYKRIMKAVKAIEILVKEMNKD